MGLDSVSSHGPSANDRLGDEKKVGIDVDDDRVTRPAQAVKIVRQSASTGAHDERAAEALAAQELPDGVERPLVLGTGSVIPSPIAVEEMDVLDDPAR